jgi:hypothetical protein
MMGISVGLSTRDDTNPTGKYHMSAGNLFVVYFLGPDTVAHLAGKEAERQYLKTVLDGNVKKIWDKLTDKPLAGDKLQKRTLLVFVSDHGELDTTEDDTHQVLLFDSIKAGQDEIPEKNPELELPIKAAGYEDPLNNMLEATQTGGTGLDGPDFDHAVAHNGGTAYVYLIRRKEDGSSTGDWSQPPRFEQDVLAVAEQFRLANVDATHPLHGKIDVILVRDSSGSDGFKTAYRVYKAVGDIKTIEAGLPAGDDLYFQRVFRTKSFASERTGDLVLIAKNDLTDADKRFYFAVKRKGHHGWMSRPTAENTFVVAAPAIENFVPQIEKVMTKSLQEEPVHISRMYHVIRNALGF